MPSPRVAAASPADIPTTQRATIRDVAAMARVSVATVSRYVNRKQRFTAEVEGRIAAAITATGYHSHPVARSMSTGRSGAVAALVAGVGSAHAAALVKGLCRVALAGGHDLICVDPVLHSGAALREVERVLAMQIDGLVLAASLPPDALARLASDPRPQVDLDGMEADAAHPPQRMAGALLARYLIAHGHRRIAFLACDDQAGSEARLQGVREALADAALPPPVLHHAAAASAAAGAAAASAVLLSRGRPDAVIACNDALAMGLVSEARALGIAVPAAVSVAGIGNMPFGRYLLPALTSVDLHADAMGAAAMTLLLAAVVGDAPRGDAAVVPEPRLVVRGSTRG
ncbi:MAG: LacI family DNA-binding transcriptional regulator [Rubrivivax sp.]